MRSEHVLFGLGLLGIALAAAFYPDDPNGAGPPSVPLLRAQAMTLCQSYLPCNRGDAHYQEIAKDFGGIGTTCGYLPAWMLWRLGCRNNAIVNRSEPDDGLAYTIAGNMTAVVTGGKVTGAWRLYVPGGPPPQAGDILYFNAGGAHEHVAICVSFPEGGVGDLVTFDMGHSMQPEGSLTTRHIAANGDVTFLGGSVRRLVGIDDLALIPMTAPADLTDHTQGVA